MWIANGIIAGTILAMFLSMLSSAPPRTRDCAADNKKVVR
jgi:hypothetical protein